MSTIRAQNRRRRSHSASSAFSSSSSPRIAKKAAVKRSHPQASSSQWGEASKWDPDNHRPGKRRRRGLSAGSDGLCASRIAKSNGFPQVFLRTPKSTFSTSSDDFGLPMSKGKRRERVRHSPALSGSSFMDVSDTDNDDYLRRLRSDAFFELERSVEENGEGFLRRMREHEYLRSACHSDGGRGRQIRPHPSLSGTKPPAHVYQGCSDMSGDEDEDDLQIYAGELAPSSGSPPPDIRMDGQYDKPTLAPCRFLPSSYSPSPLSSSPPTSPAPASIMDVPRTSNSALPGTTVCGPHLTAKDIENLTLHLANGAGSLNDYAALRQMDVEDANWYGSHAGDLWH